MAGRSKQRASSHTNMLITSLALGVIALVWAGRAFNYVGDKDPFGKLNSIEVGSWDEARLPLAREDRPLEFGVADGYGEPMKAYWSDGSLFVTHPKPLPYGHAVWHVTLRYRAAEHTLALRVNVGLVAAFSDSRVQDALRADFDQNGNPMGRGALFCQLLRPVGSQVEVVDNSLLLQGSAMANSVTSDTPTSWKQGAASISLLLPKELGPAYTIKVKARVMPGYQVPDSGATGALQVVTHNEIGAQLCDGTKNAVTFTSKLQYLDKKSDRHAGISLEQSPIDSESFELLVSRSKGTITLQYLSHNTEASAGNADVAGFRGISRLIKHDPWDAPSASRLLSFRSYGIPILIDEIRIFKQ